MPKHEHHTDPLILRRRWDEDLARALKDAEAMTLALADYGAGTAEATLLRTRLLALRTELQVLADLHPPGEARLLPYWSRLRSERGSAS